jgi:ABC-type lipoprotein export system ATPase subunit
MSFESPFSLLLPIGSGVNLRDIPPMTPLRCINICCRRSAANPARYAVVEGFSADFKVGEVTGFLGSDFHSKELLLGILGMIEKPDGGSLEVLGHDVLKMSEPDAARHRDITFGYLFTHPHLLPSFSVAENVAMPFFRICGQDEGDARERTLAALEFAGIADLHGMLVGNLDDAAHWRVAFARAIVHSPAVLVAISPPSDLLLPFARRCADLFGTSVLWNGVGGDLLALADSVLEMNEPSHRSAGP